MTLPIYYCMMCKDNLYQVDIALDRVLPFVDGAVVVDGGSKDCSLFYLNGRKDDGVHTFLHPWKDHFSNQRNNYIKRAREVAGTDDFWLIISDPDELFSVEALSEIPNLISVCEQKNLNSVMFRCRSVSWRGKIRVWESLDDYRKLLMFKYEEGIHYEGNPHEHLVFPKSGTPRPIQTDLIYEHIKWENVIWERGVRNSYIFGGGDNVGKGNQLWVELKKLVVDHYGKDLSWEEYQGELIAGTIPDSIKDWMINKARLDSGWSGASEMKEHFKYFYRYLWKNLEPDYLVGTDIP